MQFAGWVMRREVLERVGGFCTLFHHCADWELAFRIGLCGPVGCVAQPYGLYRLHAASDTRRLMRTGENVREATLAIRLNLRRLALENRGGPRRSWRARLARAADESARVARRRGIDRGKIRASALGVRPAPDAAARAGVRGGVARPGARTVARPSRP